MATRSICPFMVVVILALVACAPAYNTASNAAGAAVAIDVRPNNVEVRPGDVVSFQADVTGSANTSAQWSVQEGGGGAIDATGRYVAPQALGTYHVLARPVADLTVSSTATILVTPNPSVMVAVTPHTASLATGTSNSFSAIVTGTANTSVTWQVQEGSPGGAITPAGLYTAPSGAGTYHVIATSAADSSKSDSASVAVTAVAVAVTPRTPTVTTGSSIALSATVTGTTNQGVTWSVQEATGCGTVTATGVYAAPAAAATCHVVATSVADASKSDTATITVVASRPGAVSRPSYNTGGGFFTLKGKLYDANGIEFIPQGMNASHYDANWSGCSGNCGIPNSNANFMRVVVWDWSNNGALNVGWTSKLKSQKIAFTAGCFFTPTCPNGTTGSNKPATCVNECVSQWISVYQTFKPLERYMLLNIANEWGPPNSTVWRDTYITAVANLRAAGYLATIVIDSADGGYDVLGMQNYAQAIYDSDPQHNIIFAYHEYAHTTAQSDANITALLAARTATAGAYGGWPFYVEEFGPVGAFGATVTPSHIIQNCNANGIGWAAWGYDDATDFPSLVSNSPAWAGNFSLNQSGPAQGQPANCIVPGACTTTSCNCTSASDLSSWGSEVILSPGYGLFYARRPKATIFP